MKGYYENGSKWSKIQQMIPGRPENMIKNRFYVNLHKRILKGDFDSIIKKESNYF